jgi:hypothetical protein
VFDSYIKALDSNLSPESPDIEIHGFSVEVSAEATVPSPFLAITNMESLSIRTTSQASFSQTAGTAGGRACVLALEPDENGISLGSDSHLDANCGVYVNSSNTDNSHPALELDNDSILTSSFNCLVVDPADGVDAHDAATIDWDKTWQCPSMTDPLASLAAPSNADATCPSANRNRRFRSNTTISPGVYCGNFQIDGGVTVTFNPGIYIFQDYGNKDGVFEIQTNGKAVGNGVLLYFRNATINWGSHSIVDLKASSATTGAIAPYRGILIYSKRGQSTAKDHIIGCHQSSRIQGAVYSPSTEIDIGSNGNIEVQFGDVADWTVWIARRFEIGSHTTLTVRSDVTAGTTPFPTALNGPMTYNPPASYHSRLDR